MKTNVTVEQVKEEVHASLMQHLFHFYYTLLPYTTKDNIAEMIVDEMEKARKTFVNETNTEHSSLLNVLTAIKEKIENTIPKTVDEEIETDDLLKSLRTVMDFIEKENENA
ncbi:hypothetical protein [Enterococcus sp. DIV1059_2]|uniref:hypothetical protein n=1 Tax=Enterococcus sp. DIV1059_2 TaxID=2774664 RepID=UPI003F24B613